MTQHEALDDRRVLVVEDDPVIQDVLVGYLRQAGFSVTAVGDAFAALDDLEQSRADVVVLDRMLPGIDGIEVCRRVRETSTVPVLLLTALGSEEDRISGLEAGADDYIVKPFSPREVVLRVQGLLRRSIATTAPASDAAVGALRLDGARRRILLHGEELDLTSREFGLLAFLMRRPDQVFDRGALLRHVWGWEIGDESTVTVHIRRLREKIEPDPGKPTYLRTSWGAGYYLCAPNSSEIST
ncbi:response regulator transcription factor [Microbacterium oxydans]|uniref:response regulator transcription factor n=1 Tax=Microbacterium oxydans TaxID=82380 RepID=UPI00226B1A4E|nr:response regulator transcription factor [Microbacterium oxydans]WAA65626.1 response regulator transcription factor [Microbacterium oxydans]